MKRDLQYIKALGFIYIMHGYKNGKKNVTMYKKPLFNSTPLCHTTIKTRKQYVIR